MTPFKFIEKKNLWFCISGLIILTGFSLIGLRALKSEPILNFGIDFIGGNSFHLKIDSLNITNQESTYIKKVRSALKPFSLQNSHIQFSGTNNIFIKTPALKNNKTSDILASLKSTLPNMEILEVDYIGPSIGHSLRTQSLLIILFVSLALLLYISFRFQLNFGLAAIGALAHDTLIIFSIVSIFSLEINTAFIAALLTILGYSINDTIVIFDKIREYIEKQLPQRFATTINTALNHTLTRTINTSITTLLVILSLILFGGKTIQEFCIILAIGIISGTYSSLCIASPILNIFKSNETAT